MAAIKGSKVRLKVGDGAEPVEAFSVIAGARGVDLSLGGDEIETTTADDIAQGVTWRTYMSGMADLSISFDGIIKDKASFNQIIADRLNDVIRNYQVDIEGFGIFAGPGRVTISNPSGQFDQAATFSVTFRAAGAWTYVPETDAPVNTVVPAIGGTAQQGVALTAFPGVWTGGGISFAWQWQADAAGNGTFANISGATAQIYTPVADDVGNRIRLIVTATNSAGSTSANSAGTVPTLAP